MRKPNRIGINLFDEELKTLINASAKIFPITQEDIDNNNNPNGYEYGRIGNAIYRWSNGKWAYIVADDTDIEWLNIKNKPTTYPPSTHTHSDLHNHLNKSVIDTITQTLINTWNTVTGKADKTYVDEELINKSDVTHNHNLDYSKLEHTHDYSPSNHNHDNNYSKLEHTHDYSPSNHNHDLDYSKLTHNHDGAYYKKSDIDAKLGNKSNTNHTHSEVDVINLDKYTQEEVNTLLDSKSNKIHNHTESEIIDLDKYTKSEVDNKLAGKSNTNHTHSDLHTHSNKILLDKLIETKPNTSYDLSNLDYIEDIRNGYTEGHSHDNFIVLQGITEILVDGWNSAVSHITDAFKHITSSERTLWNTVSDKANQDDVDTALNDKSDIGHTHDYSPLTHNHDSRYYTETEIDTKLSLKSDTVHTHAYSPTGHTHDERYYTESEIDTKLASKANTSTVNGHTANTTVHVTSTDKTNWNSKAEGSHIHDMEDIEGLSLDWSVINNKPSTFAPSTHSHSKSQITDFPNIPSKTSQLINDSGFITESDVPSGVTVGTTKPTDGSMWYKVIS